MAYQDQLYFSLHKPFQNPAMLLLSPAHMLRPPAPAPSGHASVPAVGMVFAGTVQKRRYLRTVLWFVMYRYVFGQARACTSEHLSAAGTEACPNGAGAGAERKSPRKEALPAKARGRRGDVGMQGSGPGRAVFLAACI